LIAGATPGRGPLDRDVVEAYWVGNELLDRLDPRAFAAEVRSVFRSQAGPGLGCLDREPAAVPHHNFHVFAVYPWVGLLAAQEGGTPLRILDSCRVAWGRVTVVREQAVTVEVEPLLWQDGRLRLGPPRPEVVRPVPSADRLELAAGAWVSLHWQRVCDRLDDVRTDALRRCTERQLQITNEALFGPVPWAHAGAGD
jgi:hypothetical protein